MKESEIKTVGIVGLGLIGGSLAKALSERTAYRTIGYARRQSVCDEAIRDAAVSEAFTDADIVAERSDILVLALPPEANAEIFEGIAHRLKPGTFVTDVASTKSVMVPRITAALPEGVRFVSMHPMAGSERGGYGQAKSDLFVDTPWLVLYDVKAGEEHSFAEELHCMGAAVGAKPAYVSPECHDAYMARISHLPHIVAAAVTMAATQSGDECEVLQLSAGGFRDVTRIAGGNPSMWRDILFGNPAADEAIAEVMKELETMRACLNADDGGAALESYLRKAKEIRDALVVGKD